MKKVKHAILILTLTLSFEVSVHADITIFDSNAIISDGESYDIVVVKGDGTVVDMNGGDVNEVITMNTSMFNVSGGNIGLERSKPIKSYDSSVLNLSGGSMYGFHLYGESKANFLGSVPGVIFATDSSVVTVSSGNGLSQITLRLSSVLNFLGGMIDQVYLNGNATANIGGGSINFLHRHVPPEGEISKVTIFDGTVNHLSLGGNMIVRISGGTISHMTIDLYSHTLPIPVSIIGYGLNAVPYGGDDGNGEITGYWNNDTAFTINLGEGVYSSLTLYDGVIPSECVSKPESDLSGDCKVNFIDLAKMFSEWLDDGTE